MSSLLARARRRPELNLVPLIDVLTMLIFFTFVTMQFRSAQMLDITLPELKSAGKNEINKNGVVISIEKSGDVFFNDQRVTDDQLTADLIQVHNSNADIPVVIKGDEDSQFKRIAFVLDQCRLAGLRDFQLQSKSP
ncbi:MAG TPA: biopolymer transporter ExbD [Opitutaceae bacterium]|jgi:biopolymer transport protein ExbD